MFPADLYFARVLRLLCSFSADLYFACFLRISTLLVSCGSLLCSFPADPYFARFLRISTLLVSCRSLHSPPQAAISSVQSQHPPIPHHPPPKAYKHSPPKTYKRTPPQKYKHRHLRQLFQEWWINSRSRMGALIGSTEVLCVCVSAGSFARAHMQSALFCKRLRQITLIAIDRVSTQI